MPEPADQPAPPLRTWRPMILWTAGILLALGLAWSIAAVAVPYFQVRAAVMRSTAFTPDAAEMERLGGPEATVRKVSFYLRLPSRLAPNRGGTLGLLWASGKPAVPVLFKLLGDEDEHVRIGAAELLTDELRKHAGNEAVELLIAALKNDCAGVRIRVADRLGELGDPRAVGPLIIALKDKDEGVRNFAARSLGRLGDARAVEPLISALKDKDNGVSEAAEHALIDIASPQTLEALLMGLKAPEGRVRAAVANALGYSADMRAVEPLIAALRDQDGTVRRCAAEALKKLQGEEAGK